VPPPPTAAWRSRTIAVRSRLPEFAHRLLERQAVAVVPGTAFGDVACGAVRISLASSDEGVGRLCDLAATST
jgi:aspartate/methionine/tyrosine aminotransferase